MPEPEQCADCGATIAEDAMRCPACGYEPAIDAADDWFGTVALVVTVPLFVAVTGVLGYLLLFTLQQGTLGQMGPVVLTFAVLWLVAVLVVVLVRRRRHLTATERSVL